MSENSPAQITQPKTKPRFFSGIGCWAGLAVIGISLILYLIACATPAMVLEKETWRGYEVLLLGWQGFFLGSLRGSPIRFGCSVCLWHFSAVGF